ncbi:MAG: caspase family protein, partial [Saprospiraceae bacterium]|nr:caspase family protein [Saprospiraceae bacterium]
MKKQSIMMAILLMCHSFQGFSQSPIRSKTKSDFSGYFNKSASSTSYSYSQETDFSPRPSNGAVQIYAVVVGVGDYARMPQLAYPASDAQRFYSHLLSPKGGSIPKNHIRLLIDDEATKTNVLAALKQIARKADGNDVILFYFSGHGLDGAFLPIDFDGYGTRLEHTQIVRTLETSR